MRNLDFILPVPAMHRPAYASRDTTHDYVSQRQIKLTSPTYRRIFYFFNGLKSPEGAFLFPFFIIWLSPIQYFTCKKFQGKIAHIFAHALFFLVLPDFNILFELQSNLPSHDSCMAIILFSSYHAFVFHTLKKIGTNFFLYVAGLLNGSFRIFSEHIESKLRHVTTVRLPKL